MIVIEETAMDIGRDLDVLRRTSVPEPIAVIERAQMQERATQFMAALVAAQAEMEPIARDLSNTTTKSKYASLAAVDRAIRPHYTKHGLAPTFNTRPSSKGDLWITIVCELVHSSGYYKEYSIDMLADGAGPKGAPVMTRTHAIGSAVTYGKRQLLKMIFNLAEAGEDDDGNAAGARDLLNDQELDVIKAALDDAEANESDMARFCKTMKVEGLTYLRRDQIADAMARIASFKEIKRQQKATGFENGQTQ